MGVALEKLLETWRGQSVDEPFLTRDLNYLNQVGLKSELTPLAPYPYAGDLRAAKVWILMRNPGIGENDAVQERQGPLAKLLQSNLGQEFGQYPFLHLSPEIEDTDASEYWWKRRNFRGLVAQLAKILQRPDEEIREKLAQKVAILELCPYRRRDFDPRMAGLPSSRLARAALREALTEARESQTRAFVMPWSAHNWAINDFLAEPFFRNSLARTFTFQTGGQTGFGEIIAKYVFDVDL